MAMRTHKIYVIYYETGKDAEGKKIFSEHSRTSDKFESMKTLGNLQRARVNAYPETYYF